MRFFIDACLPRNFASVLESCGHVAVDARDIGMRCADDAQIAAHARREGMSLLTEDWGSQIFVRIRPRIITASSSSKRAMMQSARRWRRCGICWIGQTSCNNYLAGLRLSANADPIATAAAKAIEPSERKRAIRRAHLRSVDSDWIRGA